MDEQNSDLKLRPHHIIDIITGFGNDIQFQPHPYGHSQHLIAPKRLTDLGLKIKLVFESEDISTGCKHLMPDGKYRDVLAQIIPAILKQANKDILASRLFDYFQAVPDSIITARKYFEEVDNNTPGIEKICTHLKENPETRLVGLVNGLIKLGIRDAL